MVGNKLTIQQLKDLEASRVIHISIDPSITPIPAALRDDEEGNTAEHDPDRVITNARIASNEDGLLSNEELHTLFNAFGPLRSVYDEAQRSVVSEHDNVVGARLSDATPVQTGFYEPMWTSYTHFWKTTLGMSATIARQFGFSSDQQMQITYFYWIVLGQSLRYWASSKHIVLSALGLACRSKEFAEAITLV